MFRFSIQILINSFVFVFGIRIYGSKIVRHPYVCVLCVYTVIHILIIVIITCFIIICCITHFCSVCFLLNTSLPVNDVSCMQNMNAVENTSNSPVAKIPPCRMGAWKQRKLFVSGSLESPRWTSY